MIVKNEDFVVQITFGPPANQSSEEKKFVKVTATARTARGQKKLAKLNFNDHNRGGRFYWIEKSKRTLSIKYYVDQ